MSQYRAPELGTGGSPGHAVMYLKGACRDEDAPYPKLRRCTRNATDPGDPEHGAGISVNRWFRSVNWVAFPGRKLFYGDDLAAGEAVTRERLEQATREAIELGIYRGVEVWPYPSDAPEPTLSDFVFRWSAGTDFALRYARSGLCGRVPVAPEMLDEIIHFLNDLNREFATGTADFEWSGYHDNCVHTLRNALAAASIGEPVSVRATKLRQLFNLAIPANEALNLAALGTSSPIDSYSRILRDDTLRDALLEFGWLPARHGSLLIALPVHADNRFFDTEPRLFVLQGPTFGRTQKLLRMLDDPKYTELQANLAYFAGAYREILAQRDESDTLGPLRGDRARRVRRRFYERIEVELAEVERMRSALAASPAPEGPR